MGWNLKRNEVAFTVTMTENARRDFPSTNGTLSPPPGRPNWAGRGDLPLIYLGWGQRDFASDPLPRHVDPGTNYFVLLRGSVGMVSDEGVRTLRAPAALVIEPGFPFGIRQNSIKPVEILVWVWRGRPEVPELRSTNGGGSLLPLTHSPLDFLAQVHVQCRKEVSLADASVPATLVALRTLMEVELLRASRATPAAGDIRWALTQSWLGKNLALRATVPALCDYLGMAPSTLSRFFLDQAGSTPGKYFRQRKLEEARRLIERDGWQVKAAALHLGYKHANDLSRALRTFGEEDAPPPSTQG